MVSALYVFELAILAYFIYGALNGKLEVPSKRGALALHDRAAWLACLFPLSFIALVAIRYDPAVSLPESRRRLLVLFLAGVGVLSLLVAAVLSPRP
jgi:hypothetical protein